MDWRSQFTKIHTVQVILFGVCSQSCSRFLWLLLFSLLLWHTGADDSPVCIEIFFVLPVNVIDDNPYKDEECYIH